MLIQLAITFLGSQFKTSTVITGLNLHLFTITPR